MSRIEEKIDKYLNEKKRSKAWPIPEAEVMELFDDILRKYDSGDDMDELWNMTSKLVKSINTRENIMKIARAGYKNIKKTMEPIVLQAFKDMGTPEAKNLAKEFRKNRAFKSQLLNFLEPSYKYYEELED